MRRKNIIKTNEQWQLELSPEVYYICRLKGTESPGSGQYDQHFQNGTYNCACCTAPFFRLLQNMKLKLDGPVFTNLFQIPMLIIVGIALAQRPVWRLFVPPVMPIWVIFLMTDLNQQDIVIASIPLPLISRLLVLDFTSSRA